MTSKPTGLRCLRTSIRDHFSERPPQAPLGGAFGSKGTIIARTALVALAAKRLGRPVKLAATRAQGFTIATYRAETRHHVKLGADETGKLLAYVHDAWELSSRPDNYNVAGTSSTAVMYDYGAIATRVNVANADRNTPGFMRSPPEVPYMYALECGMDELAYALKMDPVELRRRNDTMKDPASSRPYSSRSLMRCFDEAAEAFGWKNRSPEPGSMPMAIGSSAGDAPPPLIGRKSRRRLFG